MHPINIHCLIMFNQHGRHPEGKFSTHDRNRIQSAANASLYAVPDQKTSLILQPSTHCDTRIQIVINQGLLIFARCNNWCVFIR